MLPMNGEVLEVLKEIRDEAKQTNVRLEQTNIRLASLEGRVDFLEKRTSSGFANLSERLEALARQQAESEIRLATEVVSLADVTRDVRDLFARKLDDHHMVLNHEERLRTIESHLESR